MALLLFPKWLFTVEDISVWPAEKRHVERTVTNHGRTCFPPPRPMDPEADKFFPSCGPELEPRWVNQMSLPALQPELGSSCKPSNFHSWFIFKLA